MATWTSGRSVRYVTFRFCMELCCLVFPHQSSSNSMRFFIESDVNVGIRVILYQFPFSRYKTTKLSVLRVRRCLIFVAMRDEQKLFSASWSPNFALFFTRIDIEAYRKSVMETFTRSWRMGSRDYFKQGSSILIGRRRKHSIFEQDYSLLCSLNPLVLIVCCYEGECWGWWVSRCLT